MIDEIIKVIGGIFIWFAAVIIGLQLVERLIKWRNKNGQ